MKSMATWIHDHDDRWSFILPYIGGAVLLSIFMSLFWVTLLMLCHFGLEVWRHRLLNIPNPYLHAFWHTKLDFSLIIVAFLFAVYAEVIIGALGLGQAARGAQAAARFGVIQRSMRAVLITVDEAGLFIRAIARMRGNRKKADSPANASDQGSTTKTTPALQSQDDQKLQKGIAAHLDMAEEDDKPWRNPTTGDWVTIGFATICISLIALAPVIADLDYAAVGALIAAEMRP